MVTLGFVSNEAISYSHFTLDNKKFMQQTLNSSNMKNYNKNEFSNLVLKPPPSLSSLFNQFNNIHQKYDHKDPENVVNCKCYDLEEVQSMKFQIKTVDFLYFTSILVL